VIAAVRAAIHGLGGPVAIDSSRYPFLAGEIALALKLETANQEERVSCAGLPSTWRMEGSSPIVRAHPAMRDRQAASVVIDIWTPSTAANQAVGYKRVSVTVFRESRGWTVTSQETLLII
jgi:hypothetical protein